MHNNPGRPSNRRGSALLASLIALGVLSLILASSLAMSQKQTLSVAAFQAWERATERVCFWLIARELARIKLRTPKAIRLASNALPRRLDGRPGLLCMELNQLRRTTRALCTASLL